jgi:hypothetical protein
VTANPLAGAPLSALRARLPAALAAALCSGLWAAGAVPAAAQAPAPGPQAGGKPAAPTSRVFYIPADAVEVKDRRELERSEGTYWVRAGGSLTCKLGSGTFFVEAGGSLTVGGGGSRVVVVRKGAKVTFDGPGETVYGEKGAQIRTGGIPLQRVTVYDSITFAPLKPFTLRGRVTGPQGKPAAGVAVHAFGLGQVPVGSAETAADGTFSLRPRAEVEHLTADLGPRWRKEPPVGSGHDLEFRLRVGSLKGWEVAARKGQWANDGTTALAYTVKQPLTVTERVLASKRMNPFHWLIFSPDGRFLAAGEFAAAPGTVPELWDVGAARQLPAPEGDWNRVKVHALAFSTDGLTAAVACGDGAVRLYRTTTGKALRTLKGHAGEAQCVTFSADGKALLSGGADGTVRTWDLASGQEKRRFKAHPAGVSFVLLSPDGKTLVTGGFIAVNDGMITSHETDAVRQWDLASGREIHRFQGQNGMGALSPDGRLLATAGADPIVIRRPNVLTMISREAVRLRSLLSGEELLVQKNRGVQVTFSPDGRLLLTTGRNGVVHFWELATGKEALRVPLPVRYISGTTIAPGGRLMAGGGGFGPIRVWELGWDKLLPAAAGPVEPPGSWDGPWADLAGDDAAAAYRAIAALAAGGDKAVASLKGRLRPAPARDLPLDRLIGDLSSARFATRDAASRELSKIGSAAEAALRQALEKGPPLEARRRIESVLGGIQRQKLSAEELRQLRAVAALERLGTPAARRLLEELAGGWAGARQTQEARATLGRLGGKAAAR